MGFWKRMQENRRHKLDLKYEYKTHKADDKLAAAEAKFDYKKDAVEHGIDPGLGGVLSKGLDMLGNKTPSFAGSPESAQVGLMQHLPMLLGGALLLFILYSVMGKKGKKR